MHFGRFQSQPTPGADMPFLNRTSISSSIFMILATFSKLMVVPYPRCISYIREFSKNRKNEKTTKWEKRENGRSNGKMKN